MKVENLLTRDLKPAKLLDDVSSTLESMNDFDVTHISVLEGNKFLGVIAEEELLENENLLIKNLKEYFDDSIKIFENDNILDAVSKITILGGNYLPVLNEKDGRYVGYITTEDIIYQLSSWDFFKNQAFTMVISIPTEQFSMSQAVQIAEQQNTRVLGALVTNFSSEYVEATLKLHSSQDISSVVKSFERYGYTISEKFFDDKSDDLLKDRYDELMKYLSI